VPCFIADMEGKVAEGVSEVEALQKTLDAEASKHSAL